MKKIFKSKKEETDYYDKLDFPKYLENLQLVNLDDSNVMPTSKAISLRLPVNLIKKVKLKANSMDIPYQSLIKLYISQGVNEN